MHIPRVICETCGIEMKCDKNDVIVEMMTQTKEGSLINEQSYYKIACDRYRCQICNRTVLTGFADDAVSEHWQKDYADAEVNTRARFAS